MELALALSRLENRCFGEAAWTFDQLQNELHRDGSVHQEVKEVGTEELVAAALGWVVEDEAELLRIAVAPDHRGNGLGHRLLREFLQRIRDQGAHVCFLEVRADNLPAVALYQGSGFQPVGERRGYYSDGCDALLMRRELAQY